VKVLQAGVELDCTLLINVDDCAWCNVT